MDTPLTKLTITYVPLNQLYHLDDNAKIRTISREKFEDLQRSLDEGVMAPLLVNRRDGRLIVVSGNQRLEAMKQLAMTEAPCTIITVSEDKERAWAVRMNKSSGEFDNEGLAELLAGMDEELLALTGFNDDEISKLQADPFDEEPKETKPKRYSISELRDMAKNYHPENNAQVLEFLEWLER